MLGQLIAFLRQCGGILVAVYSTGGAALVMKQLASFKNEGDRRAKNGRNGGEVV